MSDNYELLKQLCGIAAPSSDEGRLASFIVEYVEANSDTWRQKPEIFKIV